MFYQFLLYSKVTILFLILSSIIFYHRRLDIQKDLIAHHFRCKSLHLLTNHDLHFFKQNEHIPIYFLFSLLEILVYTLFLHLTIYPRNISILVHRISFFFFFLQMCSSSFCKCTKILSATPQCKDILEIINNATNEVLYAYISPYC